MAKSHKGKRKEKKGSATDSAQAAEGLSVAEALSAVKDIDRHKPPRRRSQPSVASDPSGGSGAQVQTSPRHSSDELADSSVSPTTPTAQASASYAAVLDVQDEEPSDALLGTNVYRDLSDFKTSTIKWVVGILVPVALALMTLTWTMNDALRSDVMTLLEGFRNELRRDIDRVEGGVDRIQDDLELLQEQQPDTVG